MEPKVIHTDRVPPGVGHCSQAIVYGDLVFVSGMVPRDPATNEVVAGGIEEQTRVTLEYVQAVLEAAGSSLRYVLKATCYLRSMEDFAGFNQVYKSYFPENPPARTCTQAGRLGRQFGIEIDVIAALPRAGGRVA